MVLKSEAVPMPEELKKTEAENIEVRPFEAFEHEAVKGLTAGFVEGIKLPDVSKKIMNGVLAHDMEEGYSKFALAWFQDHKDQIKEKGLPIENVSDDWKINVVLSSKEKGGMEATAEMKDYKDIAAGIEKMQILRTDMAKQQIPPETPFLLLNYLQKKVEAEKAKIADLKVKAEAGDQQAAAEVSGKEKRLNELFLAERDLAEKTMHENLIADAEKKVSASGFKTKEQYIQDGLEAEKGEIDHNRRMELLKKEWDQYNILPEKQKANFRKELNLPQDVSLEHFRDEIESIAKEKGIEGEHFFGLLEKGYKPHLLKVKKPGIFRKKEVLIPSKNFTIEKIPLDEAEIFLDRAADAYVKTIEPQAIKELESSWQKEHDQKIREEIEKRIGDLAKSPEAANGGIERIYDGARKRIVDEYIKSRAEKAVIEKTPKEKKEIEKEFGEEKGKKTGEKSGKAEKIKMPADVIAELVADTEADETGKRKGKLEELTGDFDNDKEVLSDYFRKTLGRPDMTQKSLGKIINNNEHKDIYKQRLAEKGGLLDWFLAILVSEPPKQKVKRK